MRNSVKKGCCYQCQKREPGCHSSCQRYAVFAEQRAEIREKKFIESTIDMYIQGSVAASTRGKR